MNATSNVTVLRKDGRTFHIVGTAHISERSVREVEETIERVRPDTVCVELCQTRYEAMTDATRWEKLDIFQVIRERKFMFLLANLALSSYQKRLGEKLGVRPGAELKAGVDKAAELGAELVLADRDIQATLKRTWANLGFFDKVKLLGVLTGASFSREEITEAQLEHMKDRDTLTEMMQAFAQEMPGVQIPLIDERDRFLMSAIEDAPGQTVVAVVGAGHVPGMQGYFGQACDREALSVIPPPKGWVKALKWVIPALVLGAFAFGYFKLESKSFEEMVRAWALPNAVFAAIFAALAGAKPLSVLTAAIASPITSLNPALPAGVVVGLLEAWLRKPTVADAQRLAEDVTTMRGVYRNPFSRVLLVAVATNLGSALGAYVGLGWLTVLLGRG